MRDSFTIISPSTFRKFVASLTRARSRRRVCLLEHDDFVRLLATEVIPLVFRPVIDLHVFRSVIWVDEVGSCNILVLVDG